MRWCWFSFFVILCLATVSPAQAKDKLAVLDVDSPDAAKLAALLESELVQLPDLEALERAGLQALLKEQKLQSAVSAGAAAERRNLGKLLKADVLVLLQSKEKPERHLQLTVFESRQGLRLHVESFFPTAKPLEDVRQLSKSVQTALARFRAPRLEIVAIPRFVDESLTHDQEQHGETLARLLEQELFHRPEVLVVELEEADAISREVTLSKEAGQTRRLPLYLLGEYRFSTSVENRQVSYSLELRRGTQKLDQSKRQVPAAKFLASIQLDAQKLLETALGKDAAKIDPAVESQQLIERARVFGRLGDFRTAVQLLEAALVLVPDQPIVHGETAYMIHQLAGTRHGVFNHQHQKELPSNPQELLKANIANARLRRRAVPHMEEFYLVADLKKHPNFTRDHIHEYYALPANAEWQHELDEYRREYMAMARRVLESKAERKVQDRALFHFRDWLLPIIPAAEARKEPTTEERLVRLRKKWEEDKYWMEKFSYLHHEHYNWQSFLSPSFIFLRQRTPLTDAYLVYLDEVEAKFKKVDGINTAVQMNRSHLLNLINVPHVPDKVKEPKLRPREEIDVLRHEINLVENAGDGRKRPIFAPHIWVAVSPGVDFFVSQNTWYWLRTKGIGERVKNARVAELRLQERYNLQVCADGRYVWILIPHKDPLLVALDSQSDQSWVFDSAAGLPPMDQKDGARIIGLEPGKVCLAGYFGRRWIAAATLDPASGIKLDVLHEAKDKPEANNPKQNRLLSVAQPVTELQTLSGRKTDNGPLEHRIFLKRQETGDFILIDPQQRQVTLLNESLGGEVHHVLGKRGDTLFITGKLKHLGETPRGKLDSYELTLPEFRPRKIADLPNGKIMGTFDGETYLYTGNWTEEVSISLNYPKSARPLREEWVHKHEERTYFTTGHYGLVHYIDYKMYSWERINRSAKPNIAAIENALKPEVKAPPSGEVEMRRQEIALRAVVPNGAALKMPAGDPLAWFPVKAGVDFVQYADGWYWHKKQGVLTPVEAPRLQAIPATVRAQARAGSDGRYVWILIPGKDALLAVLDPTSEDVWYLDAASGLPSMQAVDGAAVAGLFPGRALLAGYAKNTWLANATLDPKSGIQFAVFHESKDQADTNDAQQKRVPAHAQPIGETIVLPGKNTEGVPSYRVCLQRKLSNDYLWIDPLKEKAYVFNFQFHGNYPNILGQHRGVLYLQGLKDADPNKPLGKPSHYELKFPALRAEKITELPQSRKIYETLAGETYLLTTALPNPLRFSAEFPKKLQNVREDLASKSDDRTYFVSGHYGLIQLADHKLYSWERTNRPSVSKTPGTNIDVAPKK